MNYMKIILFFILFILCKNTYSNDNYNKNQYKIDTVYNRDSNEYKIALKKLDSFYDKIKNDSVCYREFVTKHLNPYNKEMIIWHLYDEKKYEESIVLYLLKLYYELLITPNYCLNCFAIIENAQDSSSYGLDILLGHFYELSHFDPCDGPTFTFHFAKWIINSYDFDNNEDIQQLVINIILIKPKFLEVAKNNENINWRKFNSQLHLK